MRYAINPIIPQRKSTTPVKLLRTIERSYAKAPFFKRTYEALARMIFFQNRNLSEYVAHSIVSLADIFDITAEISITSAVYDNRSLKGKDRIIDICLKEGAGRYHNAIGGHELYDKEYRSGKRQKDQRVS